MEKYGKSFKELNNREKREYIIEYYKFHIIGGIAALAVVFSLLNHYVFNPPRQVIADVTITAPYADPEGVEELQAEIKKCVEAKTADKTGLVEILYFSEKNDPQMQMAMTAKLLGKASTGELDILILDQDHLAYFMENEILLPLADYLTADEQAEYAAKSPVMGVKDGQKTAVAFAVPKDSPVGRLLPSDFQGYLAVYVNARDMELVKELLPILLRK